MLTQLDAGGSTSRAFAGTLLGRLGSLSTRLAKNENEVGEAQRIRHRVFCEEHGAQSAESGLNSGLERDAHDELCDHLLVLEAGDDEKIIGTQRFFLSHPGSKRCRFYSQNEFDVVSLANRHNDLTFMELGRSCILPDYRSKRTMELMWQGTWAYAVQNKVDVMIGCASFHARSVDEISNQLSFLSQVACTDDAWHVDASSGNVCQIEALDLSSDECRQALRKLPPLVKGYLRLGAMFSTQAVLDPEFGTIDVLVVLPIERISERYLKYYGEDASKHRA